jgi:hypothetical protein
MRGCSEKPRKETEHYEDLDAGGRIILSRAGGYA